MTTELYKVHRPRTFKQVLGQDDAVAKLTAMSKRGVFPHTILFAGPSGCGKTTLARIVKAKLKCSDQDFIETDAASNRGIDMVRSIQGRMKQAPIKGKVRIWLIDECHALTSDAQGAFLKILEDTPQHVHFMLATTDPQKLKPTIRSRCTEIIVKPLKRAVMTKLLTDTCDKEEAELDEEVLDKLVEYADGSARKAMVLLNSIIGLESGEQLEAIEAADFKAAAVDLAKRMLNPNVKWPEIATVLRELEDDPEGLRRLVLAFARNVLLKGGKPAHRAYWIITAFQDNFFDSGKAGLAAACWEVLQGNG